MKRLLVVAGLTLLLSGCAEDNTSAWQQVHIDPATTKQVEDVLGQAALKVGKAEVGKLQGDANVWLDKNVPGGQTAVDIGKQLLSK